LGKFSPPTNNSTTYINLINIRQHSSKHYKKRDYEEDHYKITRSHGTFKKLLVYGGIGLGIYYLFVPVLQGIFYLSATVAFGAVGYYFLKKAVPNFTIDLNSIPYSKQVITFFVNKIDNYTEDTFREITNDITRRLNADKKVTAILGNNITVEERLETYTKDDDMIMKFVVEGVNEPAIAVITIKDNYVTEKGIKYHKFEVWTDKNGILTVDPSPSKRQEKVVDTTATSKTINID